jgi:hypothetical protein
MTTTLSNLIDEVTINLSGYTLHQDRATYLASAVSTTTSTSASPLILQLGSTDGVGKGIIEIDEELMWIDSYDRVANTATVSPYGRGYLGTTAATHAVDAKVTISPTFPRNAIKKAINDTINAIGAQMYAVKTTRFTYQIPQITYPFTDLKMKNIVSLQWQTVGPSKEWRHIRNWDWDSQADTTVWGAGSQTITIGDFITPGRPIKVQYGANPTPFTSNSQDFSEQTGLEESVKDIVVYGAIYRLLSFLDPARAAQVSPQADETDSKRPYGASQSVVKQIFALYNQRLQEEVLKQQRNYPVRAHYSRR